LAYSQPAPKPEEEKILNLDERFREMKAGSQTFKDYKVIKETALDKVWKIAVDSINKKKQELTDAKSQMAFYQEELESTHNSMQKQAASMNEVIYDSTHITVLGIPFLKSIFLLLTVAVTGGLVFFLSIVVAKMKLLRGMVHEKALIADSIMHELEEFKKKAMDKQTKLSRELQNERNKWMEARKG
jgi:flagellar biosynthesis chaperone FliJ